jgi:hypothetical protein
MRRNLLRPRKLMRSGSIVEYVPGRTEGNSTTKCRNCAQRSAHGRLFFLVSIDRQIAASLRCHRMADNHRNRFCLQSVTVEKLRDLVALQAIG